MLRLILGIIIFLFSIYVGIIIKRNYQNKDKILEEILDFATFVQGEIAFFGTQINELIAKYCKSENNLLTKVLTNVHIPDKCTKEDYVCPYLNEKNKNLLSEFIINLTKLNSYSQKEYITNFKNKILQEIKISKQEVESKGDIYKKLSPVVGLAIAIIIF